MKVHLLFLSILMLYKIGNAQEYAEIKGLNPTFQNYVPLSPDVAAINKFGNIPVGVATGIPKINVPIYSYSNKLNGLNLNVTLDYHAGGVRISEIASRVGLSWALNAGGVISRIKRGIYDEHSVDGFLFQNELPGELEGNSPGTISLRPFNNMYANVMDSQPDIFNYSFAGKNGRFILGKNNDLLLLNQTNLKILKTTGAADSSAAPDDAISSFTITDEDGFMYVFSDVEVTQDHSFGINDKFVSAWYLTEIISPKAPGAKITFEYETEYLSEHAVSHHETRYRRVSGTGGQNTNSTMSTQDVYSKRLSRVNFPNGVYLNFDYYGNDIANAAGGQALESITVHDGMNTEGYVFQHDHSLNRLTLKKVVPFGGVQNSFRSPYEFEYIGSLPSRSTVPDHWGFHNGGASSRVPREVFPGGLGVGVFELPGGDRDTDSTYVKYGSLRKITYPTGGYTILDMEANRAEDSRLNKEFAITEQGPGYEAKSTLTTIDSEAPYGSNVADIIYTGDPDGVTNFEVSISQGAPSCSNCKVIAELHYSDNYSPIMTVETPIEMYGNSTIDFSVPNLVPNHTYKMKFYMQNLQDYYSYVSINWEEPNANLTNTTSYRHKQGFVGGLRVKRIRSYNSIDSNPTTTTNYKYLLEDGETSSGTLGVYPQYSHTAFYENKSTATHGAPYVPRIPPPELYVNSEPNVIVRGSSPLFDLATFFGSPVIYKRVEIIDEGLNGSFNGKEVKHFTNFKDSPVLVDSYFPYIPVQMDKWKYGLLKKHQVFNTNNEMQKEVINQYRFLQDLYFQDAVRFENFKGISIAPVMFFTGNYIPQSTEIPPLGLPIHFLSEDFYPSAGRADIKKVIEHNYFMGETITIEKEYTYDPLFHKMKSISTTRSDEKKVTKYIEYAFEIFGNDFDSVYETLFLNNELNVVINEETVLTDLNDSNPVTLFSSHVDYKNIGDNVIKPASISTKKGSEDLEERIVYSRYDNAGNPVELSGKDGSTKVYIWGYGKEFPIAKIENATYAEIAGALNITVSELDEYDEVDPQSINSLRDIAGLSEIQITTYTYEPLVGIRSITDPRGEITAYHYDVFNRLEFIKDEDGNILKEHKYHYKSN